jgi:hypothetical protein
VPEIGDSESVVALWPLSIGDVMRRQDLHSVVGGSHQWGVTSCLDGRAMLLFHNPATARLNGYDRWEGRQVDGSFHYTGQGRVGDQSVEEGANRSLLLTHGKATPLFLLESEGTSVAYLGRFRLATVPYRFEHSVDTTGAMRQVVVFHLWGPLDD